ncbi:MAG: cytochrome c [Hahellaceae bacterium]|nr:cytochrome c [Hahellaceae bacterium]MCP5169701.1 cytochrome c [Hahellaceae bacterium]
MAHAETADVVNEARQEELKHLLRHDCGSCHGMTLKGGLGPALSKQRLADKPDDFITYTILYGRTGTAMPPWQGILSEADARWLATYIKANGPEKGDQ